jgi:hypothetical protein
MPVVLACFNAATHYHTVADDATQHMQVKQTSNAPLAASTTPRGLANDTTCVRPEVGP